MEDVEQSRTEYVYRLYGSELIGLKLGKGDTLEAAIKQVQKSESQMYQSN